MVKKQCKDGSGPAEASHAEEAACVGYPFLLDWNLWMSLALSLPIALSMSVWHSTRHCAVEVSNFT